MSVLDERGKAVITELDVRKASPGDTIRVDDQARLTPLAADLVRERGLQIERARPRIAARRRRVALGADHGGFEMKEELKRLLSDLGHEFQDFGCHSTEAVDYPDYAHIVARAVARGTCDLGIMIDGVGIGSCMVANRVPGVRAAMCYEIGRASCRER